VEQGIRLLLVLAIVVAVMELARSEFLENPRGKRASERSGTAWRPNEHHGNVPPMADAKFAE